jgi:TPR repeat protein
MRRISIVIVVLGALQALLAACDPITALTVASTVVKGAAVASVQDDENAKDCSQQGLAQCEREWRQEKLAQAEALAFAQTMAEPEPTGETDAHAAFAAFLRSDEMSDGWVFLCTAANLGHPQAQLLLARAYKDGWEPVARNDVKSYTWYRLAIAGGHGFARDEMKSVAVRMEPEVRTWAEINSANWQPDYGECEVSLEATLQGA